MVVVDDEVVSSALLARTSGDGRERGGKLQRLRPANETPNLSNLEVRFDFDHRSIEFAKFAALGTQSYFALSFTTFERYHAARRLSFCPPRTRQDTVLGSRPWAAGPLARGTEIMGERGNRIRVCSSPCPYLCVSDQVVNLANAASLVYNALLAYEPHFGSGERAVNWCGAYTHVHTHAEIFHARSLVF